MIKIMSNLAAPRAVRICLPLATVVIRKPFLVWYCASSSRTPRPSSTIIVLRWLTLLAGMLIAFSAGAATIGSVGLEIPAKTAPVAAPCYRTRCVDPAALVDSSAASTPRVFVKAGSEPASEREVTGHIAVREQAENYNCLLSVGFGGELRSHGYQRLKALGHTWTINKADDKSAR